VTQDLTRLVRELTLDEKTDLLAGADFWSTTAVPRLGIPSVGLCDGPNGARGQTLPVAFVDGPPLTSMCVPCGSALGATWDSALVERVGSLLGREARTKSCRILLGPTVNLHRSPLGGRNFESYSEDPLLAGRIAAAFVRGVQAEGVACTVKHFAGNESELDRMIANTLVDERTLRELYLVPFELAVREGGALSIMTAYNRLNGEYCSDSRWLLTELLRDEWGFDGFVLTDWFAAAQTGAAIDAGLDLEMPGPGRAYGSALAQAVRDGVVDESKVDAAVRHLLGALDRLGALDGPPDGEPASSEERPEDVALAREAAIAGTVLLKNESVLPLDASTLTTIAVVGPNADRAVVMGGGSASFNTRPLRSPLDALVERLGDSVEVLHEPGVDITLTTPAVPSTWLSADGEQGMAIEFFALGDLDGDVIHRARADDGNLIWFGSPPPEAGATFTWRATAELTVDTPGFWLFSLVQTEPAMLLVDGQVVLDGHEQPLVAGREMLGMAKEPITAILEVSPERPVRIEVRSDVAGASQMAGAKLGIRPALDPDALDRAVEAAARADATIVVVGTDGDWETEGVDRTSMSLPGAQDELVARILEVAPDAVVVVNAGSVVAMPWAIDARAVLQTWFGGQEMGTALASVLFGDAEPGGRLPTTIPHRIEHSPPWGNFPAEGGRIHYGEGVLIGYRWYASRCIDVMFPFGHGLSYSSFEIGEPTLSTTTMAPGEALTIAVPITNIGARAGSEVVQLYVAPERSRTFRPESELKAFAKVELEPAEWTTIELVLDDRAFAYWSAPDPALPALVERLSSQVPWTTPPEGADRHGWTIDAGSYALRVARSSADVVHSATVNIAFGGT
jgi:beta-glucosidase